MEEVLEVSTASSFSSNGPTRRIRSSLTSSRSEAASTTRSRSASWARSVAKVIRSSVSLRSCSAIFPRLAAFSRLPRTRTSAAFAASSLTSTTTVSMPARAHTSVMPDPIKPPPMTPTFSINTLSSVVRLVACRSAPVILDVHLPRTFGRPQLPARAGRARGERIVTGLRRRWPRRALHSLRAQQAQQGTRG
jgi:hypothetical protein